MEHEEEEQQEKPSRECTDIAALIVFILFIFISIFIAAFAFVYGNPLRLINGYDSFGNVCGAKNEGIRNLNYTGIDMSDRNYLFFFNPWDAYSSIRLCVRQCPHLDLETENDLKSFMQETYSFLCYDVLMEQYVNNIYVNNDQIQFVCPNVPIPKSEPVMNRCVPKSDKGLSLQIIYSYLNKDEFVQQVFTDFYTSRFVVIQMTALAFIISFFIALLLHCFSLYVSWFLVFCSGLISIVFTCLLWWVFVINKQKLDKIPEVQKLEKMEQNEIAFLVFSVIATLVTIVILFLIYSVRQNMKNIVHVFENSYQCVRAMPFLLLQPLWTCLVLGAFIIFWIYVMLGLTTANDLVIVPNGIDFSFIQRGVSTNSQYSSFQDIFFQHPINFPSFKFEEKTWIQYMWWFNIIGFIWICEFLLACQQMIITGVVVTWYFEREKENFSFPVWRAIRQLIFYHVGSVALGSILITIFKIPRLILMQLDKLLKDSETSCGNCVKSGCTCCLWSFDKFIKNINHKAYTVMAMDGTSFYGSARNAYYYENEKSYKQLRDLDQLGNCVLFLIKCAVTAVIGLIGLLFMKNNSHLYFYAGPLFVIGVAAFFLSHCVLSIYEMVIDTLVLCLARDPEKSHLPKHLQKIFNEGVTLQQISGPTAGETTRAIV